MKLFTLSTLMLLATVLQGQVENRQEQDTANFPYYAEMMQDRSINFYRTQSAFNKYWENREIMRGSGWKQFKRWEWAAMQVIDEHGNFPNEEEQYQNLKDIIPSAYSANSLTSEDAPCENQGRWKELGPVFLPRNNTSQINGIGRLNAVALHPTDTNTFYVGACAGGFWKTTDAGNTWTVYKDSLPTLGVSSIAVNPNNPDTIYFGSGDRDNSDALGYGVFRSTDGGNSWVRMNSGMGNQTVGRLIIDPKNRNILIAATHNGIYRTTNAAASWTRVHTSTNFKDIAFMPRNSTYVYATRQGLFYRSDDNGINWTQITAGLPTSGVSRGVIAVSPLDSTLVYFWTANGSVHEGFYLSRDGGVTFTLMSNTPNLHANTTNGSGTSGQAWYDKTMTIDPTDAGVIYCGGVNIFRSDDSGKTWTIAGYWVNQIHADHHDMVSCPITNRVFSANDGGLYFTRNKGVPWIPVKSGLAIAQIYKMGASRTQKDILITGFQDNGTANYNNGWFTTRGGDGMDCAIDQEDNRYSYGELYYGSIFRVFNVNMQATIAGQGINGIDEAGAWNTPFCLREGLSTTMYVGYKNIWRSDNIRSSPPTWTKISDNLGGVSNQNFHAIENCIANPDILYASRANNTFYKSENVNDSVPSWTAITQPEAGLVRIIETDPESGNIVYISIATRVYKSLDKGATWTQVNGNLPFNVNALLLDTSSRKKGLYAGTFGGGVWYTDSTLNEWKFFNRGIPYTSRITDLEMYYDTAKDCNCNVIYASTYNRGTWYSSVYQDSLQKPIAKLETYPKTLTCTNQSIQFKSQTCNMPTLFKWVFDNPNIEYLSQTDSSHEEPHILFRQSGIYNFMFIVANCQGVDTLLGTIEATDTARTFCVTTTTNTSINYGIGIFDVQIAGKSFPSLGTFQESGYFDRSCAGLITLRKGKTYPLYVRTGTANDEQVKAYIDYNNDGILDTLNELVISPARERTHHTDSFTVPSDAVLGTLLRMRVRSDFNAIGTDPCSNLAYGQTEDYVVYIEADSVYPAFATSETVICTGQTVSFYDSTLVAGGVYQWDFGAGATPATASTSGMHTVAYSTSGYKTVSLKVNDEIVIRDSLIFVETTPNVHINLIAGDTGLCAGGNIAFEAADANLTSASYQWKFNGSDIADSTAQTLHLNNVTPAQSGIYSLVANNNGCTDTASFDQLTVYPHPLVNFALNDSSQCLSGNTFLFTNTTSISSGTLSYSWDFGDASGDTATSPTHSYSIAGSYEVTLVTTSDFGCSDSITQPLTVHPQPDFSVTKQDTLCEKDTVLFVANSPDNNLQYTWKQNGQADISDSVYSVNTDIADTQTLWLLATTPFACQDSVEIAVTVSPLPVVSLGADTSYCSNEPFSLTLSTDYPSFTHQWNTGDSTDTLQILQAGTYSVLITSDMGCRYEDSLTVVMHQIPSVHLGNDYILNPESPVNELLDAGSGFASYLWNTGQNTQSITATDTGRYSVTVENDEGCFASDTVLIRYWDTALNVVNTGIKDKVKVYPNPATTVITIQSEEHEIQRIRVYDFNGKIVWNTEIPAQSYEIQVSNWSAGTYIIEIALPHKTLNVRQILLR